ETVDRSGRRLVYQQRIHAPASHIGRPTSAFSNHELRLLLVPAQSRKGAHPRQRRAKPVLPAWDEVMALVQDSHPYHVGRLLPLPRRGRIDRRAAARTERLQASIAALGRGLEVCRRLARYAKSCTGNGNINAEGGAGANLAIRAVANRGLLGVRFAFDPDIAAVARAVDFHEFVPFAGQPPPSLSSEPRYRCLTFYARVDDQTVGGQSPCCAPPRPGDAQTKLEVRMRSTARGSARAKARTPKA